MNFYTTHYQSGEEILLGDSILWAGNPGTVVFVLNVPGVPEYWASSREWFLEEYGEGFMLDVEGPGLVFQNESDEDLDLVSRNP